MNPQNNRFCANFKQTNDAVVARGEKMSWDALKVALRIEGLIWSISNFRGISSRRVHNAIGAPRLDYIYLATI